LEVTERDAEHVDEEFKGSELYIGIIVAVICFRSRHVECVNCKHEHHDKAQKHFAEWNNFHHRPLEHFDHKAQTFGNLKPV
jgi:hypothetical protein